MNRFSNYMFFPGGGPTPIYCRSSTHYGYVHQTHTLKHSSWETWSLGLDGCGSSSQALLKHFEVLVLTSHIPKQANNVRLMHFFNI